MADKKIKYLPYTAITSTLKEIDFNFQLSGNTNSPLVVHQLISSVLSKINDETKIQDISNGDIIQALCMILAVRSKMVDANPEIIEKIVIDCFNKAMFAYKHAKIKEQIIGNS